MAVGKQALSFLRQCPRAMAKPIDMTNYGIFMPATGGPNYFTITWMVAMPVFITSIKPASPFVNPAVVCAAHTDHTGHTVCKCKCKCKSMEEEGAIGQSFPRCPSSPFPLPSPSKEQERFPFKAPLSLPPPIKTPHHPPPDR